MPKSKGPKGKAKGKPPAAPKADRKPRSARHKAQGDVERADPGLFAPLTDGERADALRTLLEDERLRELAKVGRYRVITIEPLAMKPPEPLAGRRLARIVIYDYAGDSCVDACVDLDRGAVCHASRSSAQPMLSREEEADAIATATRDERVVAARGPGDTDVSVLHYWSRRVMDLPYHRRSAAVVFGAPGAAPTVIAVVNLVEGQVVEVVPAEQW
jgi:hypothetical protein